MRAFLIIGGFLLALYVLSTYLKVRHRGEKHLGE
jgi:hypothetical protein